MNNTEPLRLLDVSHDYISDICFDTEQSLIAVTAWDGSLSIYEYGNETEPVRLLQRIRHQYPLLSCCIIHINNTTQFFVGTVQGEVLRALCEEDRFVSIEENPAQLGIIRMLPWRSNCIIAGSWDGTILVLECSEFSATITAKKKLEGKILSMDCNSNYLILVLTGNKIEWCDLPLNRDGMGLLKRVDSPLKYQVRDIKLTPNSDGYVVSSIDGRVAVEYFEDSAKQFAFRCHRMNLTDVQFVFPVDTLGFEPNSDILYTGGSDGCISGWNLTTKRKIKQFAKFDENSVVKIAVNEGYICVATSDDSFKTNPTFSQDVDLQPSSLYLIKL
ncbi:Bub3p KNAG_0B03210 [Huiozyma naganishii CBS 8797]|uniref:Anaphase-promoting complex subunit 4 WD40 domain-containing protein n=1 Tax=Huiozyma naganishii (strain ATCC MYA-139 / BCRC 22969 / CBS 8797 / KCTC 17520 / NBRC 10181 / NCYC 3082 / Yp74L-3) TaxID=1071383 RepID=J7RV38_HUIN7|nr:hypothetical protein KNAG_0B03210 [Kazachstania naganishii CBS 8797]CCK68762.1 hypothetical protein KNAG_0B03210 [Kazachstania naganishii CBS 8797]